MGSVRAGMQTANNSAVEYGVKMKDYEYSSVIQSSIKEGRNKLAYQLLLQVVCKVIQSHLEDVRLDIQTYYQLADELAKGESQPNQL
jgi:hypothetical protein